MLCRCCLFGPSRLGDHRAAGDANLQRANGSLILARQNPINDADGTGDAATKGGERGDDCYGDQGAGYGIFDRR